MKKYIALAVIILTICIWAWHHHNSAKPPLQTITVGYGSISTQSTAVGNILPKHSVTVKSTLASSGTVFHLFHDTGDYVTAGEALLQLQPNPDPEEYARALDALKSDQASLELDQQKLAHYQLLQKKRLIPNSFEDYLQIQHDLKQARAHYSLDQQQIQLLQKGSATIGKEKIHSIIYSPINGYILERFVDIGDPVSPMSSLDSGSQLFTIANMHALIFRGQVSEIDAGQIKVGMPAVISIGAYPEQSIPAQVSKLALESAQQQALQSTTAAQQSQNNQAPFNVGYPIELNHLKIPAAIKLRSGLSATAVIKIQTIKHTIIVPESALIFKHSKAYVMVITKNKQQKLQPIKLGISDGAQAQVKHGLKPGTKILANPIPTSSSIN